MDQENTPKYKSLQAGRALAALMVVLFHLTSIVGAQDYFDWPTIQIPYSLAGSGVNFFFVLSGFVIFAAHWKDVGDRGQFFTFILKRMIRIYPVYWLIFGLVALVTLAIPTFRHNLDFDEWVLLKTIFLVPQDQEIVGGTGAPLIQVAWTLQVEMVLYFFFSLLILGQRVAVLIVLALWFCFLDRGVFPEGVQFILRFLFQPYMFWLFFLGVAAAWMTLTFKIVTKVGVLAFGLGAFLFALVTIDWALGIQFFEGEKVWIEGLAFGSIVLGAVVLEQQGHRMSGGEFLQKLGAASYVLYLSHYHVILAVTKIASSTSISSLGVVGVGLVLITALAACLLAALLINRFFEIPVTKWLRKRCVPR